MAHDPLTDRPMQVTCAVLHMDDQGNTVPCPSYPHAPEAPVVDELAEARRLLAEDADARMKACSAEIEEVLARHGMRLQITQPQIAIVPA